MNLNALAASVHLANEKWWQDVETAALPPAHGSGTG